MADHRKVTVELHNDKSTDAASKNGQDDDSDIEAVSDVENDSSDIEAVTEPEEENPITKALGKFDGTADLDSAGSPGMTKKPHWYQWPLTRQKREYHSLPTLGTIGIVSETSSPTESLEPIADSSSLEEEDESLLPDSILRKRNSIDIANGNTGSPGTVNPPKRARFNSTEVVETFVYEAEEDEIVSASPVHTRMEVVRDHLSNFREFLRSNCSTLSRLCINLGWAWFLLIAGVLALVIWILYSVITDGF